MKTKMIIIITTMLLIGLALAGVAYAQTMPSVLYASHNDLDNPYSVDDVDTQAVCLGEITHPVLDRLAEEYEVDYQDLLDYFCNYEFGVGELEHALATAALEDVEFSYDVLLVWRYNEGMKDVGWGEIWQELGLIGMGMPDVEDDDGLNLLCAGDLIHPVLSRLADEFNVAYSDILVFFCEDQFGIGEIKLALETAQQEDIDLSHDEILGIRAKGDENSQGWGRIWQDLGLIGRDRLNKGESIEPEAYLQQEKKENNKPVVPPGLSGEHPGKGRGPNK